MSSGVEGKHIVITGAASGIGAATAKLLASRGANVFIGDLNRNDGERLANRIRQRDGEATFMPLDVTDPDAVRQFFASAIETYGPISVALNNAGIDHTPRPMAQVPDEDFHRNIAVNLTGVWYCMKAQIEHMLQQGGGHIINLASVAGTIGSPLVSAYCASKHGVIGLSKSAAIEYAKANIRVNAVCPSFVRTPMVESTMANMDERQQQKLIKANPMKRLGEPAEIATAIAWLCTDESSFMTGHSVVLDGGLSA